MPGRRFTGSIVSFESLTLYKVPSCQKHLTILSIPTGRRFLNMKQISAFCQHKLSRTVPIFFGLCILALSLTGCGRPPSAAHAFPPATVTVSKPVEKEVVNWNEFTG